MTPLLDQGLVKKHCYTDTGALKPKAECRALLINHLILEDMLDIDDAENRTDKTLRALNLWNEPTLEEILREDPPADASPVI